MDGNRVNGTLLAEDTWYVAEKPYIAQFLLDDFDERRYVDYFGPVFDTEDNGCMFYRHGDGIWHHRGSRTDFDTVDFRELGWPFPGRYIAPSWERQCLDGGSGGIVWRTFRNDSKGNHGFQKVERYAFFVHEHGGGLYADDMLAAMNYCQPLIGTAGLDLGKCLVLPYVLDGGCYRWTGEELPFSDAWDTVCWNAAGSVSGKDNPVERLCNLAGMGLKQFSEYFGIKYRTVQNWKADGSSVPDWAVPLFEMKLLKDGRI